MAGHLREAHQMITQFFADANFDDAVPFVFGHPDDVGAEVMVHNELALLLRKAQMHLTAVIRANSSGNLHSMAVHARVVLECAGQIQVKAQVAYDGSPDALERVLNASEYDFMDTARRMSRGSVDASELHERIVETRERFGDDNAGRPNKVRISNRVAHLPGGRHWHSFLGERFCGSQVAPLSEPSLFGGVVSCNTEADRLAVTTGDVVLGGMVLVVR